MSRNRIAIHIGIFAVFFFSFSVETASADIYGFKDKNGTWHFTNVKSNTRYRLFLRTGKIEGKQYILKYDTIIGNASKKFGVESRLIKAVIMAESSFNPNAVSKSGAQGLMQLMPITADDMNVGDPFDPEDNIYGGTQYLSLLLKKFNHDKGLALAAYNAGPKTVSKHNSIPPIPQTEKFVSRVMRYYNQLEGKEN
ncbi:MAG: lytic transglycosylase domain-containing protein [Deltaproteobacteria bacterium]|nr:lytic transglycosylase domain-containing protein [Deltaproteobacteria bacterium]